MDYAKAILTAMDTEITALSTRLDVIDKSPVRNAVERQQIIGALDVLNRILKNVQEEKRA